MVTVTIPKKEYQRLDKRIGEIEKELKNLSLDKDY